MKFLIFAPIIAAVVSLSHAAKAGTVETAAPSTRQIKISGVNFEYRVHDNGLQTSGTLPAAVSAIDPAPIKIESTRVLVLEYRAIDNSNTIPASMRTDLFTDVRSKCQDLGDTELTTQSKDVAGNLVVRGGSELGSSVVDENNPPTWGRFVCKARITAHGTAK